MFGDALGYYSAGKDAIKGKLGFLYVIMILIYILGIVPTLLEFCIPAQREYYADATKLVYQMINDPSSISKSGSKSSETEYKSQGQLLAEKTEKEIAESEQKMRNGIFKVVDKAYDALIINILYLGSCSIFIKLIKGKDDPKFSDLFSGFTSGNYIQKVISLLLKDLAVSFAYGLCFFPGVFLNYSLALVNYIMAEDSKISFPRAWEISFKASSGYRLKMFAIDFFAAIPTLLSCFIAIIGIKAVPVEMLIPFCLILLVVTILLNLIINPFRKAAMTALYEDAKGVAKSYGIVGQFELFDPDDYANDNPTQGMTFYG